MGSRWRSLFRPVRHVDGVVEPRVKGRRGCRIPWWPRITLKHVPSERPAITSHPAPGIELRQIEQLVTLTGQRILEIGCGAGRLTLQYAPRASSVIGVDPDPARIARAKQAATAAGIRNARFRVGLGERKQAPDGSIDTVLFSWSL